MTDTELLAYNQKGFIPGPGESEEQFLLRIAQTQQLTPSHPIPPSHWAWAKEQLLELYDFAPESLPAHYSDKQLAPWEGAACWIENNIPTLQLRTAFQKGSFLRLYSRDEVLAHEAIHAARAAFDEPANEEFFAHSTSFYRWRRVLGPILKRPLEAWLFLSLLATSVFFPPLLLPTLFYAFFRLIRQHSILRKASQFLLLHLRDKKTVRAALFRMTDSEIKMLSQHKFPNPDQTLRWRLIQLAYIKDLFIF